MSMNVKQTTEVVALMPTALTVWVALLVPVYLDTPEVDLPAQVSYLKLVSTQIYGELKTRDWKTRDVKRGTKLQDWKTRD